MNRSRYEPSPPAAAEARRDGERWTLVFVRELRHPPERVWRALTEPEQIREWAPFDASANLATARTATLEMAGGEPMKLDCTVRRSEPPKLLEYTWGDDLLRWELVPSGTGTRLTLSHTTGDPSWMPKTAAGWHLCLDVAEVFMDGAPIGRITGEEAKNFGWEKLNDHYAERLDIR